MYRFDDDDELPEDDTIGDPIPEPDEVVVVKAKIVRNVSKGVTVK